MWVDGIPDDNDLDQFDRHNDYDHYDDDNQGVDGQYDDHQRDVLLSRDWSQYEFVEPRKASGTRGMVALERISAIFRRKEEELRMERDLSDDGEITTFEKKIKLQQIQQKEREREQQEREMLSKDPAKARANAIQLITLRRLQKTHAESSGAPVPDQIGVPQSDNEEPLKVRMNLLGALASRANRAQPIPPAEEPPVEGQVSAMQISEQRERGIHDDQPRKGGAVDAPQNSYPGASEIYNSSAMDSTVSLEAVNLNADRTSGYESEQQASTLRHRSYSLPSVSDTNVEWRSVTMPRPEAALADSSPPMVPVPSRGSSLNPRAGSGDMPLSGEKLTVATNIGRSVLGQLSEEEKADASLRSSPMPKSPQTYWSNNANRRLTFSPRSSSKNGPDTPVSASDHSYSPSSPKAKLSTPKSPTAAPADRLSFLYVIPSSSKSQPQPKSPVSPSSSGSKGNISNLLKNLTPPALRNVKIERKRARKRRSNSMSLIEGNSSSRSQIMAEISAEPLENDLVTPPNNTATVDNNTNPASSSSTGQGTRTAVPIVVPARSTSKMPTTDSISGSGEVEYIPRKTLPLFGKGLRDNPNVRNVRDQNLDYNTKGGNITRQFLYQGHAWQVITTSTVKDRHLFLFSDVLVVAKQVAYSDQLPSVRRFEIKSLLDINQSKLALKEAMPVATSPNAQKTVILAAVKKFTSNPVKAIAYLIAKRVLPCTPQAVAQFLHTTPSISRRQLGKFLGLSDHIDILQSYLTAFAFKGLRIDVALRFFLGSFRLPSEVTTIDNILNALSRRWVECNTEVFGADGGAIFVVLRLIFAIMALNAEVHGSYKSSTSMKTSQKMFVDGFIDTIDGLKSTNSSERPASLPPISINSRDPKLKSMLSDIYSSILSEKLDMADAQEKDNQKLQWRISSEHSAPVSVMEDAVETVYPSTLSLKEYSHTLTLSTSSVVPGLQVSLIGVDIQCEPSVLDFSKSNSITFRIKGTAPGRKLLMFHKMGRGSRNVASIPTRGILIEPAFMKYKFQLTVRARNEEDAADAKRETNRQFLFAVSDADTLQEWTRNLQRTIASTDTPQGEANNTMLVEGGQNLYGTVPRIRPKAFLSDSSDSDEETAEQLERDAIFKTLKSKIFALGSKGPLPENVLLDAICKV
ncbi:hypothetical protein HDV05_001396 [Chytridiales sp. JEL 0842]|nr:hypothetical protein HDV05_001396 [Chytridiales sp. JEL 0842]